MQRSSIAKAITLAGASGLLLVGAQAQAQDTFEWKLVTSWPKNFPGVGQGPERLAKLVEEMSDGRLTIEVFGAGQLVPGFEVFDAVAEGTAQMGHSASYYWKGKAPAAQFFAAVPFGMNAQEMNAWLHYGGGLELWNELYDDFGVEVMTAGASGVQMGGWYNQEINSVDDLDGLKMRMPGLGGEVMNRMGVAIVNMPGGEIFTSLQSGAIDATEWIGPYNDLAFGLHQAAEYYYYPGWHEPTVMFEAIVNDEALAELPADLQAILRTAVRDVNQDVLDEYTARNNDALATLINEHDVQLRKLPDDVLAQAQEISAEVVQELADSSDIAGRIYESYRDFQDKVVNYHAISEQAYYNARNPDGGTDFGQE
ncbi:MULTISPECIES: TRAP transporter substrate-binding protein [Halomonas]|uniref:TRAP transporter substrate-binding protein n=3 Tax=Halomonas TaxID=2745 RepID=A0AAU7KHX7_9GAMM|nr:MULTISPECIES: TRAP transporter substrate-binding protein [Halomonas]MBR9773159.1 TRAP transporter substrate-binding protein [Gammaproteobacteria bacterium]KJZ08793.1 ABC transporter substrate-binding protein [Halomonas sp. S2151]MAR73147.1 ABC transporter substrate-binding protein [Halomonas sp.]MAY70674.1 ABC transporter substrate-binding protein [Halomonas sp.]MBR9880040.1 TRAP transporter substrate-binding protein [Gammaproteobacteria bacterium]|tara:strand:+ start:64 stop:1167 length:1104 start_codon:yes stop_codon:yes gene_type:complete